MSRYDLLIIGGGINGLGIAADASARGLSVLLVEKGDYGGGTTSASSRLIHGGLRYLQYGEVGLVAESLRERGILVRTRPHLVRPIELLIPAYRGLPPPGWKIGAGLALYALLARDPLFPPPSRLSVAAARDREPGLAVEGLTGGHVYWDAQMEFPERLCVELMLETAAAGGEVRNHTRVVAFRVEGGRVAGASLRDEITGEQTEVDAAITINSAGPWVDEVNRLLPDPPPRVIGGTWGTHLVLPVRPDGPRGALYAAARKDGRPVFLLPWDRRLLVGTTDVPFTGDPDSLRVEDWEIEYLLAEANRLFPGCEYAAADVQWTTLGVRALPASGRPAAAVTRRHFLIDHERSHGIPGLASVVGGKLTTYRSLAAEVVDWAVRRLEYRTPNAGRRLSTAESVAPAPWEMERDAAAGLRAAGLSESHAPRLVRLYGRRWEHVVALVRSRPKLGSLLAQGCPALQAEAVHAIEHERARTPEDVALRRLMLLPPAEGVMDAIRALFG